MIDFCEVHGWQGHSEDGCCECQRSFNLSKDIFNIIEVKGFNLESHKAILKRVKNHIIGKK